jgi:nicotinate-nucleotide--dimethylbenzimidazole phosphoribosyltransferase
MSSRAVIDHVIEAITPVSEAQAAAVRMALGPGAAGSLGDLAARLAAARHAPRPRVDRKVVVVCAGDHGEAEPGIELGALHPTVVAAETLTRGDAALARVAANAGARVLVLDCGTTGAAYMPSAVVQVGRGPSADVTAGPARTMVDAILGIESGIAVALALADEGLDVLALGRIGLGGEVSSAALVAAATRAGVDQVAPEADAVAVAAALAANTPLGPGIERIAALGGPETAVLVGLILAAASMNVPVVLDDHATSAAALAAAALAPALPGYLVAAHGGTLPAHRRALAALGLAPLFELGLARGEGTGAAMALPLIDGAAQLLGAPR